jgi:hypothetical protein
MKDYEIKDYTIISAIPDFCKENFLKPRDFTGEKDTKETRLAISADAERLKHEKDEALKCIDLETLRCLVITANSYINIVSVLIGKCINVNKLVYPDLQYAISENREYLISEYFRLNLELSDLYSVPEDSSVK